MKFSDEEKLACAFHLEGGFIHQCKGHPLLLAQQLSAAVEAILAQYRQDTANQINSLQTLLFDITRWFDIAPPIGSETERRLKLAMPSWENPSATLKESSANDSPH